MFQSLSPSVFPSPCIFSILLLCFISPLSTALSLFLSISDFFPDIFHLWPPFLMYVSIFLSPFPVSMFLPFFLHHSISLTFFQLGQFSFSPLHFTHPPLASTKFFPSLSSCFSPIFSVLSMSQPFFLHCSISLYLSPPQPIPIPLSLTVFFIFFFIYLPFFLHHSISNTISS